MANKNYEEQILKAIQIVVDDTIKKADFDKTIEGTVIKCVDSVSGKYVIQYQDSEFYAYSNDINSTYSKGSLVYILIPNNDMGKNKTILGTVEKLGSDYIPIIDEKEKYQMIGSNCIKGKENFKLNSFISEDKQILYNRALGVNLIKLDKTSFDRYMKNADAVVCGGNFLTNLPPEQRYRGDYGLIFTFSFNNPETKGIILKDFILNVDEMNGNPYHFNEKSYQYKIFNIDKNEDFNSLESIVFYEKHFPLTLESLQQEKPEGDFQQKETMDILNETIGSEVPFEEAIEPDAHQKTYSLLGEVLGKEPDIFCSGLELSPCKKISQEELMGSYLTFTTEKGTIFDKIDLDSDYRTIEAFVKVKGKTVDIKSKLLKYFWFIENNNVDNRSDKYNQLGGKGWECLNTHNVIQEENDRQGGIVEWVPASYKFITSKKDNIAKETKYKCVAIYNDDIVVQKEIIIYNYDSIFNIEIKSSNGNVFSQGIGKTDLICSITKNNFLLQDLKDYSFIWAKSDSYNNFINLPETEIKNGEYDNIIRNYEEIKRNIEQEIVSQESQQDNLLFYEEKIKEFSTITRIDNNKIYNLKANSINKFSNYSCSVYYKNNFIGTASITIVNKAEDNEGFSLVINNGNQIFKYDTAGVSPVNGKKDSQIILPLTFSLYDNEGVEIPQTSIGKENIKWKIRKDKSLIIPSLNNIDLIENKDNFTYYKGIYSLIFSIADHYNAQKSENNVELIIKYKNKILRATSNLAFLKEGDNGTNGTNFFCQIQPNTIEGFSTINPVFTHNLSSNLPRWNFIPNGDNEFIVSLWKNGERIYRGFTDGESSENLPVSIKWSMLTNRGDKSNFSIGEKTGKITFNKENIKNPVNIIKCELRYNGLKYFATLPITLVRENSDIYSIEVPDKKGFNEVVYTTDGLNPAYSNTSPFEVRVFQENEEGIKEDISNKDTNKDWIVKYNWFSIGHDPLGKPGFVNSNVELGKDTLIKDTLKQTQRNQQYYKPIEVYSGYNLDNGVFCTVEKQGIEIGTVHIPVHFYLNRYGQGNLNDWDGNSISINEEGGIILAPQIGAGKKDENNTFTGMVMGDILEGGKDQMKKETGLFGYHKGQRTVSIDAETGSAKFGSTGGGQIIIDPGQDSAVIKSGNYSKEYQTGMKIDLTNSTIEFANNNFKVDSEGHLTARGFATSDDMFKLDERVKNSIDGVDQKLKGIEESAKNDKNDGGNLIKDSAMKSGRKTTAWLNGLGFYLDSEINSDWKNIIEKNKYLQSVDVYENDYSRKNTISQTLIKQNLNNDLPFNPSHVICSTNEIILNNFEERLSVDFKIRNGLKSGYIQAGILYFNQPLRSLGLLTKEKPIFEDTIILNPDQGTELTSYHIDSKIPKNGDVLSVWVDTVAPSDTNKIWLSINSGDDHSNEIKRYNKEKRIWETDLSERRTCYDERSIEQELWVYRPYTKSYSKSVYTFKTFKAVSAIVIFSMMPGYDIELYEVPEPEWRENLYFGDPYSDNFISRVSKEKSKDGKIILKKVQTEIKAKDVANNLVSLKIYPSENIVPATGEYDFGDLIVTYSNRPNVWKPYPGEIYGKNTKLDGDGFRIQSGNKNIYIDENEIISYSGDNKVFEINEEKASFNKTETKKIVLQENSIIQNNDEDDAFIIEQKNGFFLLY